MPKIQQRDFYFGAALSMFFKHNKDSKPSLLESICETSQLFKMTTDTSDDFYIYMKYTENEQSPIKLENHTWRFNLTKKDKEIIEKCAESGLRTFIILICGKGSFKTGEIAVLTLKEYNQIKHKTGFLIRLEGIKPKEFDIYDKNTPFSIKTNRIEQRFTDIV